MRTALLIVLFAGTICAQHRIDLVFTGGHETEQRDHGRPDILIAAP